MHKYIVIGREIILACQGKEDRDLYAVDGIRQEILDAESMIEASEKFDEHNPGFHAISYEFVDVMT